MFGLSRELITKGTCNLATGTRKRLHQLHVALKSLHSGQIILVYSVGKTKHLLLRVFVPSFCLLKSTWCIHVYSYKVYM